MEIRYERCGNKSSLVISEEIGEKNYRRKILKYNRIPSLVPVTFFYFQDKIEYHYDITGLVSMKYFFSKGRIGFEELKIFHQQMICMTRELKSYLLDLKEILLEMDVIFLDPESKRPYFCYLPVLGEYSFFDSLKHIYKDLMGMVDYQDERAVSLLYKLEALAMEDQFHEQRILKAIVEAEERQKEREKLRELRKDEKKSREEIREKEEVEEAREKKGVDLKKVLEFLVPEWMIDLYKSKKRDPEKEGYLYDTASPPLELVREEGSLKDFGVSNEYVPQKTVLINLSERPFLVLTNDQGEAKELLDFPCNFGSDARENQWVIESKGVSRKHGQLILENGDFYFIDFNSKNGSKVGGNKIPPFTKTLIKEKDQISIGGVNFRVTVGMLDKHDEKL